MGWGQRVRAEQGEGGITSSCYSSFSLIVTGACTVCCLEQEQPGDRMGQWWGKGHEQSREGLREEGGGLGMSQKEVAILTRKSLIII